MVSYGPKRKGRRKDEHTTPESYEFIGKTVLFGCPRFQDHHDEADVAVRAEGHEIRLASSVWDHQKDLTTERDDQNGRLMNQRRRSWVHRKEEEW